MASQESPAAVVCSGCLWEGRSLLYCMHEAGAARLCVCLGGGVADFRMAL